MLCYHPRRVYLLSSGPGGCVQFDCETCRERASLPETMKPPSWTLQDLYPCECTKFGLPTFSREELPGLKDHVALHHVLRCLHCDHTSISLPEAVSNPVKPSTKGSADTRVMLPYRTLLTTGTWGKEFNRRKVTSMQQLFPSDQIVFVKTLYEHHAIVTCLTGDDRFQVMHYVPEHTAENPGSNFSTPNSLRVNSRKYEARTDEYSLEDYKNCLSKVEYLPLDMNDPISCLERADNAAGEVFYELLRNNCEHFVRRIKTNESLSQQVTRKFFWIRP